MGRRSSHLPVTPLERQLVELLRSTLLDQGIPYAELGRRNGVTSSTVSSVLNLRQGCSMRLLHRWLSSIGFRYVTDVEPDPDFVPPGPNDVPPTRSPRRRPHATFDVIDTEEL